MTPIKSIRVSWYASWWCLRCGRGPVLMAHPIIGSEICSGCGWDLLVTHTDKKVERYGPPNLNAFVAGEMTACLL